MKKIIRATTVPRTLDTLCRFLLRELSEEYEVVAVSSPGEELFKINKREGVRVVAISMERRISLIKDLKSLWKMWIFLRHEKPDLVHSMTPKAGLICMVSSWLAGVPVRIHTFTGLVWPTATGIKRRVLMVMDWFTCLCATNVIPEGEGVKNDLLNYKITKKPIKVLGHGNVKGVDLDYFKPDYYGTSNSNGPFTFIFVGRVVRDKGINELVSAFDRLHREQSNTRLLLVGDMEDVDPISTSTLCRINQGDGILAVGRQDDVRYYYAQSNVLVLPSYREGFPNVVIEAGAMELPCIVTDVNGSREIIINGENGIIVPPKDEDALFGAMRFVVNHPKVVATMAANARPLIATRFEQKYVRQCLYDYYHELLSINKMT